MYIIIWKHRSKDPILDTMWTPHHCQGKLNEHNSYDEAQDHADEVIRDNPNSDDYYDYKIYEEVNQ